MGFTLFCYVSCKLMWQVELTHMICFSFHLWQANGRSNSTSDLPKDPKLLSEVVLNLQKQVQEKDDALRDISEKLSRKSEECESLMEERDIMRSKNSFDLQQVQQKSETVIIMILMVLLWSWIYAAHSD